MRFIPMLDKAIQYLKEHREPYRGAKSVDSRCRNHGSCNYCSRNRQIRKLRGDELQKEALEAYYNQECDLPV